MRRVVSQNDNSLLTGAESRVTLIRSDLLHQVSVIPALNIDDMNTTTLGSLL